MNPNKARHQYDIDGIVKIASAVALPELKFFKVAQVDCPDLTIEVAPVGGLRPRFRSALVAQGTGLVYREHLGGLFANFHIEMGTPMKVSAGPLLALSPHVLYTNIVEPLLRFLLVKRGFMLLHAACISIEGRSIMLSAQTDTGKTSTILSLLRRHGGTFYSDDMVVVSDQGTVSRYPKPLTISAHTLRSVPSHRLAPVQRLSLTWQSRLHSRGGRATGKRMSQFNLPMMAMNAGVQMMIPPPKYMITDLVDCEIGGRIDIRHVFLIERGSPALVAPVHQADALTELLANTEDAYGFPPYAQLAPRLVIEGEGYDDLRLKERAILSSALRSAEVTRLRVDDFSWPEMIRARSDAPQTAPARIDAAETAPAGSDTVETIPAGGRPLAPVLVPVASGPS
jgi:dolichol-phosphate mannosyltransferase